MRQLRELVEITQTDSSLRKLASPDGKSVIGKLYRAILSGSDASEDQIVSKVYGEDSSPSLPAYQKLKARLRNVLIDSLLDVSMRDKPDYSSYRDAYRTLQRQYASAQILLSMRAYHNCVHVLERVYRVASKYEIVELQYQSSQLLMGLYLGVVYNIRKFETYSERSAVHREDFTDNGIVTSALYTFKHGMYNRLGNVAKLAEIAREQADIAEEVRKRRPGVYKIRSACYLLHSWACYLSGDLEEAIQTAKKAETDQLAGQVGGGSDIYSFRIMQFDAYGLLRQPDAAREVADRIEADLKPATINWLDFQEKKFFHYVHQRMYGDALQVVLSIDKQKMKKMLSEKMRQLWEVIDAMLYFFYKAGLIESSEGVEKFRLSRFLNSLPTYSTEKRGMNVQILIIHTMLLILLQRYDEAIDRVEALEKYCSRHLRNDRQLRSNCFIRMLTSVVKGNFHEVAARRYAEPYVKKLQNTRPSVLDIAYHTELMAYEDLWNILLSHLGNKVHMRKNHQVAG